MLSEYPFVKRIAFKDEKEFRLFYINTEESRQYFSFVVPLSAISRIILSPWIPSSVGASVAKTITGMPECGELNVTRSTLIENEKWKSAVTI